MENNTNESYTVMPSNLTEEQNVVSDTEVNEGGVNIVDVPSNNNEGNIKMKKNYVIPLIVIVGLLVILIALGCYKILASSNPRNTYVTAIDNLATMLNNSLDATSTEINKPIGYTYNIELDLNSISSEMAQIIEILNKVKINADVELDYSAKKSNINLNVLYNNSSLINANVFAKNNEIYVSEDALYDKMIKMTKEELDTLWTAYDIESYKIVINNVTEIVKNNLKEEYFESEDETIQINGKDIKTVKHSLSLTGQELYDLENTILTDMIEDKELVEALASISSVTKEDIKTNLKTTKEELELDAEIEIEIDTYLNKSSMTIEKVVLDGADYDIVFERTNDEEYQIKEVAASTNTLGALKITEAGIELAFEYDGIELIMNLQNDTNKTKTEVSIKSATDEINLTYNESNKDGNGTIQIKSVEEQIDFKVNFTSKVKEISEVSDKDTSNAILYENLTEADTNTIMTNLYQNAAVMSLMQDISAISATDQTMEY